MSLKLDHFFICASVGAPEADRLIDFGLSEGTPNDHPGQGTANRRFFFHNAFLELLWVANAGEVQSSLVRRTGLWQRWSHRGRGVAPFGIGLRPSANPKVIPFDTWEYCPPYLPAPFVLHMGANSEVASEPLLFYLDFNRRPDASQVARRQPLQHQIGFKEVTRLRVRLSQQTPLSPALQAVQRQCSWLDIVQCGEDLLTVGFDKETKGQSADFRPALPLVFRW